MQSKHFHHDTINQNMASKSPRTQIMNGNDLILLPRNFSGQEISQDPPTIHDLNGGSHAEQYSEYYGAQRKYKSLGAEAFPSSYGQVESPGYLSAESPHRRVSRVSLNLEGHRPTAPAPTSNTPRICRTRCPDGPRLVYEAPRSNGQPSTSRSQARTPSPARPFRVAPGQPWPALRAFPGLSESLRVAPSRLPGGGAGTVS